MIDHVSIAVRDLKVSARFYEPLLATLGLTRLREWPTSIGYGKKYPEFWINERKGLEPVGAENGAHYHESYYAAFIRDPDGNRIEAVTFVAAK